MDVDTILIRRSAPWIRRAESLAADRIADARSHAWHALTERVVASPDGRGTHRAVRQARSYQSAERRLDELASGLESMIRNARAEFYRDSFSLWADQIPDELRSNVVGPSKSGENAARSLVIHGRELGSEIKLAIEQARQSLLAACTLAGGQGTTDRQARQMLATWEQQRAAALQARARMLISDSDVAIFQAVGRTLVAPEYLEG